MGLGNPGESYRLTRHNVGYQVLDNLMREAHVQFQGKYFSPYYYAEYSRNGGKKPLILVRSKGYMNQSGEIVTAITRRYKLDSDNFMVILDNMDLPPGQCRLKISGGDAGHNGLKSLMDYFNSPNFIRLYIGVGRPGPDCSVVDHVLGRPDPTEQNAINQGCRRAVDALKKLAEGLSVSGIAEELNRRES